MPEIRQDPVSGRWAIIAPERNKRPTDFVLPPERTEKGLCPLCPGNEELTPPEVLRLPERASNWRVRVVPNKYPALVSEGWPEPFGGFFRGTAEGGKVPNRTTSDDRAIDLEKHKLFERIPGWGVHEVIVEGPEHGKSLFAFDPEEVILVWEAYRLRFTELSRDPRWRYILIFKNRGGQAGASLSHDHSQIIALPFLPPVIKEELERSRAFFEKTGECLCCRLASEEEKGPRKIWANSEYLAFSAYAPRQPLEVWILPRKHKSDFRKSVAEHPEALAEALLTILKKLEATLPQIPYNLVLHTAPPDETELPYYHWHLEIVPALTKIAGFEWGAGVHIVPLSPEKAADFLRRATP